jgi:hypothetical protein
MTTVHPIRRRSALPPAGGLLPALGLLVLLGAGPGPALARDPAVAPRVTHLESTARGVRFRVAFDAPRVATGDTGEGTFRVLSWPGLKTGAGPGEPAIPFTTVRVALPPGDARHPASGTDLSLRAEAAAGETVTGVRFPPTPWPGGDTARRPAAAEPAAARNPAARILSVGIERGLRVATVAVYPVRWDPGTDTAVWSREVLVTVDTATPGRDAGRGDPRRPARPDAAAFRGWSRTLVNPEAVPQFRTAAAAPDPPLGGTPDAWFDDAGGWLKIDIAANGLYALDAGALSAAGVPVFAVDPRTFRLFAGPLVPEVAWAAVGWDTVLAGPPPLLTAAWDHVHERPGFGGGFADPGALREIPILVEGEGDGTLSGADRVVFYALGPDNYRDRFRLPMDAGETFFSNPYTNHTVYWLAWEGTFPDTPLRMATVNAAPGGGTPVTEAAARVHVEDDRIYAPSLFAGGLRWQQWFMELLNNFSNGIRLYASLPHAVGGTDLAAHIRLWGANLPVESGSGDEELHHVQVDVNGEDAGLYKWGGSSYTTSLSPQDVFVEGVPVQDPSDFVFRVPQVPSSDPSRFDQVYVAWFDVTFRRLLRLDGQSGELPVDAGAPGRTVRIIAPPAGAVYLLDVSDAWNPRLLGGAGSGTQGTDAVLDFAFASPDSGHVAVWGQGEALVPAGLAADDPPRLTPGGAVQWLRNTGAPLDYVIIAHDGFADEAERLAERRRESLYPFTPGRAGRARVVRVSDIMDEFAWGMWDPAAVRHFLEYAYLYYGAGADPLSYCLFLGDHTYDFRGYGITASTDFVPSWEDNRESIETIYLGNVQYASDDPLAQFDDADNLIDLAVGRLTVSSAAEAQAVIDKIVSQEETPVYGTWRATVLLAADDLCQRGVPDPSGSDFLNRIESVDVLLPADFDRRKVYLVSYGTSCSIAGKPEANADFVDAVNSGAWLVNYIGHGDETFYADEGLLRLTGLGALQNAGRYPVFVATASRSAKFNQPDQQSITESLVNLPAAGPVAAYGSVSNQTFAPYAYDLNLDFIDQLFPLGEATQPVPVGVAFREAKLSNALQSAKYALFGDPASLPAVPGLPLGLTAPDTLVRGGVTAVTGTVAGSGNRDGQVELRAEGPRTFNSIDDGFWERGEILFRGPSVVTADAFSGGFAVPVSATTGTDARIRGYAWGPGWDALGVASPRVVSGTADPGADTEGPAIGWVDLSPVVTGGQELQVSLQDSSGIRLSAQSGMEGIEFVVTDPAQAEVFRSPLAESFSYLLGSHTRGTARVVVPDLDPGPYTFTVNAFDTYDNPSSLSETVEIGSGPAGARFSGVYVYPNPTENGSARLVFSIDRSADVTIRIFTVSGRRVLREDVRASAGTNGFTWDGRDEGGDPVANGVYLVQLSAPGKDDPVRHLERLVVMR